MLEMTERELAAYKYALRDDLNMGPVGDRAIRALAMYIKRNMEHIGTSTQIIIADPGSTVQGVKQTIIK